MKFWLILLIICAATAPTFASETLETDVLVVGGSQSGVMAAIQASRSGSRVILLSEDDWLGGSTIKAGVSAIDGNELTAFQTGLWGEFLGQLAEHEPNLLQYGWVSLYTFNPQIGKAILNDLIKQESNITWLHSINIADVLVRINPDTYVKTITGIELNNGDTIQAKVTIDATELGDLLALANVEHRIGWETQGQYNEPSAPISLKGPKKKVIKRYPIQELTWVFYLKDYKEEYAAPPIPKPTGYSFKKAAKRYWCAFDNDKLKKISPKYISKYNHLTSYKRNYSPSSFLSYGQISPDLFMINWPQCGNDYSVNINRVFESEEDREEFFREAHYYSLWFARYIYDSFDGRFGLAAEIFPASSQNYNVGGMAYIPYHRESRRIFGLDTVTEQTTLPTKEHQGTFHPKSIAIANYANDHHYRETAPPDTPMHYKFASRAFRWGGRYTSTPFSITAESLIPINTDGLVVAEKSISTSHMANGSTRLQPVCMQIGQAAGALASLAAQNNIQPFEVSISDLQASILNDPQAPPSLVPLFDVSPDNPHRNSIQRLILSGHIKYPSAGYFNPQETVSEDTLSEWGIPLQIELLGLTKEQAAHELETKQLTLSQISPEQTSQPLPNFKTHLYCGNLKATNKELTGFKLEYITQSEDKLPVQRVNIFQSNVAKTAGIITTHPKVYKQLQELAPEKPSVCLMGQFNNSGAWILVTDILE